MANIMTAEMVAAASSSFQTIEIDHETVYWTERRPHEGGRTVVVSEKGDMTPPGFDVRSRLLEYGGKAFALHLGRIYFVNAQDQRIYCDNVPITEPGIAFVDLLSSPHGLIAVAETDHLFIALIDVVHKKVHELASGHDFYASPALSPDGKKLAFLCWDDPHMPWDETDIYVATLLENSLKDLRCLYQGASHFQPSWSPEGHLHYVSDKTGWWNLYRDDENLCPLEAEFGLPEWQFGMSTYAFWQNKIICSYIVKGEFHLATLDPETKKLSPLPSSGNYFTQLRGSKTTVAYIRGSATTPAAVVKRLENERVLATPPIPSLDKVYTSEALSFPTTNNNTAYGFFYKTTDKAPLLIKIHGGPTAQAYPSYNPVIQYWTSHGFSVLDINYRGSTGYGSAYRSSLYGHWGDFDVADAEAAARFLIDQGLVDPHKIAISGSSAGGYTVLLALAKSSLFQAGASYYGISDLPALQKVSHRFEASYIQRLMTNPPLSPLDFLASWHSPVIFFQGLEDRVAPPDQTIRMHEALRQKGLLTELVTFANEGHGLRSSEAIISSLRRELAFYKKVFL